MVVATGICNRACWWRWLCDCFFVFRKHSEYRAESVVSAANDSVFEPNDSCGHMADVRYSIVSVHHCFVNVSTDNKLLC